MGRGGTGSRRLWAESWVREIEMKSKKGDDKMLGSNIDNVLDVKRIDREVADRTSECEHGGGL